MVCTTVSKNKQIFEANTELINHLLLEILTQDKEKHFHHDEQQDSHGVNGHKNTE